MSGKLQNRVLYLSVPESLRGQIEQLSGDQAEFAIDPSIPLPVELPTDGSQFKMEELSWEMMISGMLLVLAEADAREEWLLYYRRFVLALRPAILGEFTEAAILKARNGDFDLALEIMDSLRGLFPASPVVMLNRILILEQQAGSLMQKNDPEADTAYETAQDAYDEILSLHPCFPQALFNAGFFYLDRKDFSRAKELFFRFTEYGDTDEKLEKAKTIIKDIEESGLEDESFSEAYVMIQKGNEEAGMRSIHDFMERYPSVWNGWFVLGWALRRLGRWEDGAAAFGKALELGGTGADTRNEYAICLMESGDLAGARRQLEAALREDPENVKIISNLGVLSLKSGNTEEAAAFFRTVLELDPGDIIANNFFAD